MIQAKASETKPCSAEEIAEKRRIAIERQKMLKQQKLSSENKNPAQLRLTSEQIATIQSNHAAAKGKPNNCIPVYVQNAEKFTRDQASVDSSSKVNPASANRGNPYARPAPGTSVPNKLKVSNTVLQAHQNSPKVAVQPNLVYGAGKCDHSVNSAVECINNNELKSNHDVQEMMRQENVSEKKSPAKLNLTIEQREMIEKNRLAALERAKSNKIISAGKPENLAATVIPQLKIPSPRASNRLSPYAKPEPGTSKDTTVNKDSEASKLQQPVERKQKVCIELELISKDRFVARCDYNDAVISEFKKIDSKQYDQKTRSWSFHIKDRTLLQEQLKAHTSLAVAFVDFPDFVMKVLEEESQTVDPSSVNCIEPALIDTLFEFQKEAVTFGISKRGRLIIADEMGLGKTREALAIADFYREDWPLLIVTTASMKTRWRKETADLLPSVNVADIRILDSKKDGISDARIVICSYMSMENNMKRFILKEFKVIIFDESHSLKNQQSKQTKNATKLASKAARVILLTGTPAMSRPSELFPQLAIVDSHFADFFSFTKRYCRGHNDNFGWNVSGSSNLGELNIILRKKFMIRRLKDEVNSEMAGKTREIVRLKLDKSTEEETSAMEGFSNEYKGAKGKVQQQHEILINWYAKSAELKKGCVCRFIGNLLKEDDEKVIIFAYHHCLMNAISEFLTETGIKFMRIDGSTNNDIRSINVDRFQNDPTVRCAVLSIRACSAGITLTSASKVVFAELDWTPSNILQAESRAHRIGQQQTVKCYILIAESTADEVMWKMLIEKQRNLNKIGLVANNEHFMPTAESSTSVPTSTSLLTKQNVDLKAEAGILKNEELNMLEDIDLDEILQAENEAVQIIKEVPKSNIDEYLEGINFDDEEF